jgi:hypothetical protein
MGYKMKKDISGERIALVAKIAKSTAMASFS